MSISSLIPIGDREDALLDELTKEGKPLKTGLLIKRVLARFALQLTSAEIARVTPSGYQWWPGCIRFDLDRLQKKGKVRRHGRGYWEIRDDSVKGLTTLTIERLAHKQLKILEELIRKVKSEDIPFSITIMNGEITLKLGEAVKMTAFDAAS